MEKKAKKETKEQILKDKEELNNKYLRSIAELQNYKKRKEEEICKMMKYSNEELLLELLPIIDNFERAIKLDDENLEDELSKFLEGFKMIYAELLNVLKKNEIEEIKAQNEQFNPEYHEAVLIDNIKNIKDNEIIEVLQKGYKYKDKVIRHSYVKVNRKGEMSNE